MRLFRRRRDRWAVIGRTCSCSPRCGYLFVQLRDGEWWANTDPADYPDRWGKLGSWENIEELDADCAAYLQRTYGPDRATAAYRNRYGVKGFFGAVLQDVREHLASSR